MGVIYTACHIHDLWVELSNVEIDEAARHGMNLRRFSLANGHKDRKGYGFRPPSAQMAIKTQALGAVAEAAVRKALHIDASLGAQTYGVADLPGNLQVRLIGREYYGLRVYPNDEDHWKVIGVVIPPGCERKPYRIPGWILASEARKNEAWKIAPFGGPPMWAVPQECLNDARELWA